jgi:hypothetical protein
MAEVRDDNVHDDGKAPWPPPEPEASDCCGEGCIRCVHDVHDEAMQRYRRALAAWQARQVEPSPQIQTGTPAHVDRHNP